MILSILWVFQIFPYFLLATYHCLIYFLCFDLEFKILFIEFYSSNESCFIGSTMGIYLLKFCYYSRIRFAIFNLSFSSSCYLTSAFPNLFYVISLVYILSLTYLDLLLVSLIKIGYLLLDFSKGLSLFGDGYLDFLIYNSFFSTSLDLYSIT